MRESNRTRLHSGARHRVAGHLKSSHVLEAKLPAVRNVDVNRCRRLRMLMHGSRFVRPVPNPRYSHPLVFKNQMKVEKGKVIDIQNRVTDLKQQFDDWSTAYAQDPYDAQACATSQYYTPYYKDWCDAGRKLKAQYDAAQVQLTQEKSRLEQMQENIRRKGYGNGIYDPD